MDQTEAQLIDGVRKGEAQAYRSVMARYGRQVQLVVAQLVEDADDVAELWQDVFLKVFDAIDQFDEGRASLSTWISRIACNLALNHLRRSRPTLVSLDDAGSIGTIDPIVTIAPTDGEPEAELLDHLDTAIDRLRPEERLLVHLRYYEGRSLTDIAYITDIATGALASRLQRIRNKLKQHITLLQNGKHGR